MFDRIKLDCGTREELAKSFFRQLLDGVRHCHEQGVCHRDLKPENLLLQDAADTGTVLKIADFGFSARFAMAADDTTNMEEWCDIAVLTLNYKDISLRRFLFLSFSGAPARHHRR